jgi:hypothetical protein
LQTFCPQNLSKNTALADNPTTQRQVFEFNPADEKHEFGLDHHFDQIKLLRLSRTFPVRDYEGLKSYVDKVKGERTFMER